MKIIPTKNWNISRGDWKGEGEWDVEELELEDLDDLGADALELDVVRIVLIIIGNRHVPLDGSCLTILAKPWKLHAPLGWFDIW